MSTSAPTLELVTLAQPHENRDWHGRLVYPYRLTIALPPSVSFHEGKRNPTLTLYIPCVIDNREMAQDWRRFPKVLAEPSIALLIRQLRRRFYPGEEEIFRFNVTQLWRPPLAMARVPPMECEDFEAEGGWLPLANHRHYAKHKRLRFIFVQLNAETRARLSVWLDQQYTEGVLT